MILIKVNIKLRGCPDNTFNVLSGQPLKFHKHSQTNHNSSPLLALSNSLLWANFTLSSDFHMLPQLM